MGSIKIALFFGCCYAKTEGGIAFWFCLKKNETTEQRIHNEILNGKIKFSPFLITKRKRRRRKEGESQKLWFCVCCLKKQKEKQKQKQK